MINIPLYMVSGDDIKVEISRLENLIHSMKKELAYRGDDGNYFKYGFQGREGEIHGADTLSQAVEIAVEHFKDDDARFKVTKVYLPQPEAVTTG